MSARGPSERNIPAAVQSQGSERSLRAEYSGRGPIAGLGTIPPNGIFRSRSNRGAQSGQLTLNSYMRKSSV
eukprot:7607562-Pyramimonas_sp.AAC.1